MIKPHLIMEKVHILRWERNMSHFCSRVWLSRDSELLVHKLISLIQFDIFMLDDMLERNEYSSDEVEYLITTFKDNILARVCFLLEGNWVYAQQFLSPLFQFYEIEQWLRMSWYKTPLEYDLEEFYRIKSCDVYLNRKIILFFANREIDMKFIELFDQLGEVLDDMMDVQEDIDAINPNRFLLSLVNRSIDVTLSEYASFIEKKVPMLLDHEEFFATLWLEVELLIRSLREHVQKDRSWVESSKTNEMLDSMSSV